MTDAIRIYLTDLGAYNEGRLVGEWLELPMGEDELQAKIDQYSNNGASEFFITDSEGPFNIGEYDSPMEWNEFASEFDRLREDEQQKVIYLVDVQGYKPQVALASADNVEFYPGETLKGLAEQFVKDDMFTQEQLMGYLDFDAIARDLGMDYHETDAGVFRAD